MNDVNPVVGPNDVNNSDESITLTAPLNQPLLIAHLSRIEFGEDSVRLVGLLLAYTPDEWNLGSDEKPTPKAKKAG